VQTRRQWLVAARLGVGWPHLGLAGVSGPTECPERTRGYSCQRPQQRHRMGQHRPGRCAQHRSSGRHVASLHVAPSCRQGRCVL